MSNEITVTGHIEGDGDVEAYIVSNPGPLGLKNVDMVWLNGKLYTKVDHDAIERIVNDLVAVEQITGPVATGPSCRMLAERIKRAVGTWR